MAKSPLHRKGKKRQQQQHGKNLLMRPKPAAHIFEHVPAQGVLVQYPPIGLRNRLGNLHGIPCTLPYGIAIPGGNILQPFLHTLFLSGRFHLLHRRPGGQFPFPFHQMRRDPVQGSQDDQQREGPEIIRPMPQDVLPQHVPRPGKKRLDRKENTPPVGMSKTVSQLVGKIPHRQSPGRGLLPAAVAILPPQFLTTILASSAHI